MVDNNPSTLNAGAASVSGAAATRLPPATRNTRKRRTSQRIYFELPHPSESVSKHPWCHSIKVIEEEAKVSLRGVFSNEEAT